MTLRLVALMSVVLLLSLAAFGLMMNHYQDQVMAEVAHTASEVGRATLRTFEARGVARFGEEPRPGAAAHWVAEHVGADDAPPTAPRSEDVEIQVHSHAGPLVIERLHTIASTQVREREDDPARPDAFAVVCESTDGDIAPEDCIAAKGAAVADLHNRFFIDIDNVRAESDPTQGLVLKFNTFKAETSDAQDLIVDQSVVVPDPAAELVLKRHEDISFPIPVQEYDSLFASVRRRSLWMFVGVFLVGTVLSAGVASRFTRPIRRLDGAIRRLSEGDLEVRVQARGNDEIARLGRAFNEMTRSLRANRQRSREMVRREKHSALGRLAAGVAHDIRNPLHSIGLTLQHLRDTCRPASGETADEFDRSIEIIRGEIHRLDKLVGNFLRFAKTEARERHRVDLRELLTETASLVGKEAEWRDVEVSLELGESAPTVVADGEAIRSSILNLVLNSFEAMPNGGRLTLALEADESEARLEVSDTGEGIAEGDQDKVFDFAFTTKDGGNGLGLAMVYQCVAEDHGGRVSIETRSGGGTRVRMALPLGTAEEVRS